jgi:hypothetical protein
VRRWQLFTLGLFLGVALFLGAGLLNNPFTPAPKCPGLRRAHPSLRRL